MQMFRVIALVLVCGDVLFEMMLEAASSPVNCAADPVVIAPSRERRQQRRQQQDLAN